MNEDDRNLEDRLKAMRPADVTDRLRHSIGVELAKDSQPAMRIRRPAVWIAGLAGAAACVALGSILLQNFATPPAPTQPTGFATAIPVDDPTPLLDLPPTLWAYQMALGQSERDLNLLLDYHGRPNTSTSEIFTVTSRLE